MKLREERWEGDEGKIINGKGKKEIKEKNTWEGKE